MEIGIETVDASSLNLPTERPRIFGRQGSSHTRAIKTIFLTSLLLTFVGVPVLTFASLPFLQIAQPLSQGTTSINAIGSCAQFLGYYFRYHRYPGFYDWLWFLIGLGLRYGTAIGIASILYHLGWITMAAAVGILSPIGLIGLAGGIVAF